MPDEHNRAFLSLIDACDTAAQRVESEWQFPHRRETWRLSDLIHQSVVCASLLGETGVRRGDRVALAIANGADFVVALLALWRLGAVAVPLKPAGGGVYGYLGYLAAADRAVGLSGIVHDESAPLEPIGAWAASAAKGVWSSGALTRTSGSVSALASAALRGDEIALLQLTSGSMSQPRPVIVTHRMIQDQIAYLVAGHRAYAGKAPAMIGSWLPVHHDAGLFIGVLVPLALGCDNVLASPRHYVMSPRRWLELIASRGVEASFMTNSAAVAACRSLGRGGNGPAGLDLGRLHLLFGAEKLQVDVLERFEEMVGRLGMGPGQIHVGYGMAESTLGITRTDPGPVGRLRVRIDDTGVVRPAGCAATGAADLVSVGRALPGSSVVIRSATGQLLGEDRLGQICLKGPCITPGYFRNAAATAERFRGRWMASGALGFLHEGELYFVSRLDDVLNIGGVKVIPEDVEQAVEDQVDAVRPGGSCLIGVRNPAGVCVPTLLVEAKPVPSDRDDPDWLLSLRRLLVDRFDLLGARIVPVAKGTVEKTSAGKKRRKIIAERFVRGEILAQDLPGRAEQRTGRPDGTSLVESVR